jgi:hypothetical protein
LRLTPFADRRGSAGHDLLELAFRIPGSMSSCRAGRTHIECIDQALDVASNAVIETKVEAIVAQLNPTEETR